MVSFVFRISIYFRKQMRFEDWSIFKLNISTNRAYKSKLKVPDDVGDCKCSAFVRRAFKYTHVMFALTAMENEL